MSEPLFERIMQNIASEIAGLTEGNGYSYTLEVERPKEPLIDDVRPRHNLAVLTQEDVTSLSDQPQRMSEWELTAEITVFVATESSSPIDTTLNRRWADVYKKLLEDTTRGGHAIDTRIEGALFYDTEQGGGLACVTTVVVVHCRHSFNDPYSGG